MCTSSPSSSDTEVPPSPDSQRQKPPPIARRRQRKFGFKKLAILAALAIVLVGCAHSASLPASWKLAGSEGTKGTEERTSYNAADLSTRTRPASVQDVAEAPAIAAQFPLQDNSTATPFPLAEPTFTLEPAATPTGAIINTRTPTASASPTATDTSTSTPTASASPTATSLPTATLTPTPTVTSQPEIKRVVIISIDGLRPDALELADTPTLDNLIARGAYSPSAQTVKPSFTLPGHVSMLDGVPPEKHGIVEALPCIGCRLTIGPTLFSVAHDAGLSTGIVAGKEKLNYLVLPNSIDKLFCADAHDMEVKDRAVELIEAGLPDVLFIHFPDTDRVGHAYGWMSSNQLQAVTFVDGMIGQIVAALDSRGYLNSTLLIVTADHGGHGKRHGDDSPVDRTIPWLAVGPGVPAGVTLTGQINTYDTAATALYALDLPIPEVWEGRPVLEVFQ